MDTKLTQVVDKIQKLPEMVPNLTYLTPPTFSTVIGFPNVHPVFPPPEEEVGGLITSGRYFTTV